MDLIKISHALSEAGLVTLLVLILIGGQRKWWVYGWQLEESERRADEWKAMAQEGRHVTATAVDLARRRKP